MSTEVVNKIIKRMLIAIKHNDNIQTKGKNIELRKNYRVSIYDKYLDNYLLISLLI
jgi:hypothetical protein